MMIFPIYDGMELRKVIRKFITEVLGDHRFESGAMTYGADQLILFAENDKMVYEFAATHRDDKMAIYNYVIARYKKQFGPLEGDRETIMYDFLANYEPPGDVAHQTAESMFGKHFGKEVFFNASYEDGSFSMNVKQGFIADAQQMADRAGYVANVWGEFRKEAPYTSMKVVPKNDHHAV